MTQPAPRRVLVDLDNIEFYRPQPPSKSLQPESALSILPGVATRKTLPRGDSALLFDRPYGWNSSCNPTSLNSFDIELARCANAASLATSSPTDDELMLSEPGNEALNASTSLPTSSPSLSSSLEPTDLPGPFGSTASQERIEIPTGLDGHSPLSPEVQERDQPPDIQPCVSHPDEPSVDNRRCSSASHFDNHDNHDLNIRGTPSSHTEQNVQSNKPPGERENDQVLLGAGPQQLKQNISIPALSEGEPLLNDQRAPSIRVVDSGPEGQLHSESDRSLSAESMKAPVRQRSSMPPRKVAAVAPSLERPSTITKPPRRKSFEVAQARIVGRRNRPRRSCQPEFDIVQHDRGRDCPDLEESLCCTKRRKRATRRARKVTSCPSSGPIGQSLGSLASSARSAESYHSQDILGLAVLTVETHALGTSYFFSFEPSSPNELDAPQLRFSLDEPRRLTAPSSTHSSYDYMQPPRRARMGGGADPGVPGMERKAAISGSVERM
ncbi:hypothetical protein ASPZODRAFT_1668495 [Penicilliopsis zonata CBS 506.65]|uniref:Uncharacterized protein n=1 Tax=Penicilliopsis zonata CBS 506.65 TaxID=1073090 RepID=A0A1L9S4L6_9EURO|nr:hypothetical protein ASPZODRAFT_1668495 [Penicilliopsis zonata CBS 506.65]OJJ42053.1 hypothetical protein ASPZODRAFT_1668495 [Penicilliopsis zonata CBS 506.65]